MLLFLTCRSHIDSHIDKDVARLVGDFDVPRATSAPPQFEDRWAGRTVGPCTIVMHA